MSDAVHYDYGTAVCTVSERGTLYLDDVPDDVGRELERADFQREDGRWVKRHRRGADDSGVIILTATPQGDQLRVETRDVVGIVGLVPGTNVEIEPKVGWEAAVEMLLTVNDLNRGESYFGIPLADMLSGTSGLQQILVLLAINYIDGVRTIRRDGLVRTISIERRTGFEGNGSIDMAGTLRNKAQGQEQPVWIDSAVQYDRPVNAAVHRAGRVLLGLFQRSPNTEGAQFELLRSLVDREIRWLESTGVESDPKRVAEYQALSVSDLPRQRRYYARALRVARSILAGSLLGGGDTELLIDYVFGMERVFQDYSQRVVETELGALREIDQLGELSAVECVPEAPLFPFEGDERFRHEPDHLLVDGDSPVAVLDSKYYGEGKNPLSDGEARSRLFTYAYLSGVEELALLAPGYHETVYRLSNRDGHVAVVSPGDDSDFSCRTYRKRVRAYLRRVLSAVYPTLQTFVAAEEHVVAFHDAPDDLGSVVDTTGPFGITSPTFPVKVLNALVFADLGVNKSDLLDGGMAFKDRIEETLGRTDEDGQRLYPAHRTTCLPIYRPAASDADGTDDQFGVVELHLLTETTADDADGQDATWELNRETVPVY